MGLNISGLIIDTNYHNRLEELETILGESLAFEKEVTFHDAIESWKGDEYCDVYFSEEGTFVFLAMEKGGFEFYAKNQNAFSFVFSESSMTFTVNYVEKGNLVRSIMTTEGEMMENQGDSLECELEGEDTSELIEKLIEETLGESFYDIEEDAVCYRYTVKELKVNANKAEVLKEEVKEQKPWWKIW